MKREFPIVRSWPAEHRAPHAHVRWRRGRVDQISRRGGAAFFRVPLHELFGITLPLEEIARRAEVDCTAERVFEATSDNDRVTCVERFLLQRLPLGHTDRLVETAVQAIRSNPASIRVGVLAQGLGLSRDRFEKRFRRVIGSSPKQLASLLRLHQAIRCYRPDKSLTELSFDAGYADQSHFNREFKLAIGESPQRFFRSAAYC